MGASALVLLEPAAHLGAIGGLLRCVVEIHCSLLWLTGQSILCGERYPTARAGASQRAARGVAAARAGSGPGGIGGSGTGGQVVDVLEAAVEQLARLRAGRLAS